MKSRPIEIRFWERVEIIPFHSCWEWIGPKMKSGYGVIGSGGRGGKQLSTHRLSYELHFGKITKNICVLHKCDNPSCVNPSHLFLGTQKQNIEDMVKKGRRKGERHAMVKLSEKQIFEIRRKYIFNVYGTKKLAKEYNVIPQTIHDIVRRKSWKHI